MKFSAKKNGIQKEYFSGGRNGKGLKYFVLDVVKQYITDNPNISYTDLKSIFKEELQGSIGVLKNQEDLDIWLSTRQDGEFKRRFFVNNNEVLMLQNQKIYVCNQWGNTTQSLGNFEKFLNFTRDSLGYKIEFFEEANNSEQEMNSVKKIKVTSTPIKNIILYGPPGVGKTYNHKKIVSLIENGEHTQKELFESILKNNDEDHINETFEQIKKEGRVEFVTFHQSFSYEDFIEGFRPNEEGKIELEDGIFKVMADKAKENLLASSQTEKLSFKAALDALLSERIGNSETVEIAMKRENSFYRIYDYNDRTIFFEKQKGDSVHNLSLKTLENMYNKESVDEIKGGMKSYYDGTLQALLKIAKKTEKSQPQKLKNHYLIIDEINRGNISKIFGELITLIEEDKRDSLHVTLPYSKRNFSVPSNLYIIATMNSTDKSIALIDIALRRRFTFLKMKPDSALVQAEAKELFKKLNEFITSILGADFQIGHSYFMNYDDLSFVLEYKIKPLLEEYFFANPDRLEEAIKLLHLEQS